MKKKVYLSTYCNNDSYGAALQCCALLNKINDLGYDCIRINDKIKDVNSNKQTSLIRKTYGYINNKIYKNKIDSKHKKGDDFINKYIKSTIPFNTYEEILNYNFESNIFVAGSDQIWSPVLLRNMFFLRFAPKDAKKISYAASMSSLSMPKNNEAKFLEYVNDFDNISVREGYIKDYLNGKLNKKISVDIDPTLFYNKLFYEPKETEYKIKKKYILVFTIYWDKKYNKQLKELHKKYGYEIVVLNSSWNIYCTNRAVDACVSDFLYLVHNAEFIITSSFHGTVFSMIYNKPFYSIVNPTAPERISNLLTTFNLQDRIVTDISQLDTNISYENFNKILEELRIKSTKYLQDALGE